VANTSLSRPILAMRSQRDVSRRVVFVRTKGGQVASDRVLEYVGFRTII